MPKIRSVPNSIRHENPRDFNPNGAVSHPLTARVFAPMLARWSRDRRGNIPIMFAACLPALIATAALAVDVGYLFTEKRRVQGAVDLAAISAAENLTIADTAARATLGDNGINSASGVAVVLGRYDADPAKPPAERFAAGETPFNAARVRVETPRPLLFGRFFSSQPATLAVEATASQSPSASFSVGSRLLAVRGGLANQLLGALTGGHINLSVMDYEALASADISLGDQLDALASEIGVTAGTYDDVLDADVAVGDWLRATAAVLNANGDGTARSAIDMIVAGTNVANLELPLAKLISLGNLGQIGLGQAGSQFDARLKAMDVLMSSIQVANGNRQVEIDLGASIPGVSETRLVVTIGERPQFSSWLAVGSSGTRVTTVQTRIRLFARIDGGSVLPGTQIQLPIAIDLAEASARLSSVECVDRRLGHAAATIAARPGLFSAWVGDAAHGWDDLSRSPAVNRTSLISTPLLNVLASAHVSATNTRDTLLEFTPDDFETGNVKRADTVNGLETLASSLISNLRLSLRAGAFVLDLPPQLMTAVGTLLGTAARPLDGVIAGTLETLGLHLGEADVRVYGARCGGAALAG